MEFLRVPVVNPYGINNKQRLNYNNVDINRNWSFKWDEYVGEEKGTSPFSEPEARYVRDLLLENKDNMINYLNLHTIGGRNFVYEDKLLRYVLTPEETGYQISNDTVKQVSNLWKKTRNVDNGILFYGLIEESTTRPRLAAWIDKEHGVVGLTLECFAATRSIQERNSAEIITMNVEHIVNFLINVLRYFNR